MMFKRDDEVGFQLLEKQFEVEENLIECKRLELETEDEIFVADLNSDKIKCIYNENNNEWFVVVEDTLFKDIAVIPFKEIISIFIVNKYVR